MLYFSGFVSTLHIFYFILYFQEKNLYSLDSLTIYLATHQVTGLNLTFLDFLISRFEYRRSVLVLS